MYILVQNDAEFIQADPNRGKLGMPMGYPCLFYTSYGYSEYSFIYIPPKIKDLDSFIAGVNAAC